MHLATGDNSAGARLLQELSHQCWRSLHVGQRKQFLFLNVACHGVLLPAADCILLVANKRRHRLQQGLS